MLHEKIVVGGTVPVTAHAPAACSCIFIFSGLELRHIRTLLFAVLSLF